jgi:anaerobic selenocysteine-containing dehydrogenase
MSFGRTKKNPVRIADKGVTEWQYAACGYCSTGCSIEVGLNPDGKPVASRGVVDADVNRGKLCLRGIFEHELFDLAGRESQPLQAAWLLLQGRQLYRLPYQRGGLQREER